MNNPQKLLGLLKKYNHIYIQPHDFPDHDAVASAFGLKNLLSAENINSTIIYKGTIQRNSLKNLIDDLKIEMIPEQECNLKQEDKIVIIDGCKGNKNVSDLIGDEIAVIDHHEAVSPDDVIFSDIRPHLGSCSTLVYSYWKQLGKEISPGIATALMVGLLVDTLLMTRGVSQEDVTTYSELYALCDIQFVNRLLRNNIQQKDLLYYKKAIEEVVIKNKVAFCFLEEGCNQNLLGILGDFFLSLQEVDLVLLCAKNNSTVNFSIRSELKKWNAAKIIQSTLDGIGFGGGHQDMAGGIIKNSNLFQKNTIIERLYRALKIS